MALLTFLGATQQVTGSCYLIETRDGARVLLECGMRQGRREDEAQNRAPFAFDPASLDAVVISHAHIDHTACYHAWWPAAIADPSSPPKPPAT